MDIINLLLIAAFAFLFLRVVKPTGLTFQDYIPQPEPEETPSAYGRNREFPPDFTEEEKILLTQPYHDYERTTEEMDKEYERFRDLFKTYVSRGSTVDVIRYKDDCFFRPVILGVRSGQAVTIVNNTDIGTSPGLGGESWEIGPFEKRTVYPKLVPEVENQTYWQYSCSEKGIGGYFVKL